jgi:drug/metabolite transporter (DMT)-like permease
MPPIWKTPTPSALLVMASVGVLGYLALLALDRMAAQAPVSAAAPFAFLQLAFTVVIETIVDHERPETLALVGMSVLLGVAFLVWRRAHAPVVERAA